MAGKNWTIEDEMMFESDLKDSIIAGAAYFNSHPSYCDLKEVDFDEFCDSIFKEF